MRKLTANFSQDDFKSLPDEAVSGEETFEKEVYRISSALLTELGRVRASYLSTEVDSVLEAHDTTPRHMQESIGKFEGKEVRTITCEHALDMVVLRGYKQVRKPGTHLWLARRQDSVRRIT